MERRDPATVERPDYWASDTVDGDDLPDKT
jgi:hypothetical protein